MPRWSNDGLGSRMPRAQTQPLLDSLLLDQVPRDLFLLVLARLQVLHGQALLSKCLQRRFPNTLADPLDVLAVVLKQNLVSPHYCSIPIAIGGRPGCGRRGLKLRSVLRNTSRSNPDTIPSMRSPNLAINCCM